MGDAKAKITKCKILLYCHTTLWWMGSIYFRNWPKIHFQWWNIWTKLRQSFWKLFDIWIKNISDKSCFLSLIIRFSVLVDFFFSNVICSVLVVKSRDVISKTGTITPCCFARTPKQQHWSDNAPSWNYECDETILAWLEETGPRTQEWTDVKVEIVMKMTQRNNWHLSYQDAFFKARVFNTVFNLFAQRNTCCDMKQSHLL